MQIRLTEAEVKLALAVSIFTKTGLRLDPSEFEFRVGIRDRDDIIEKEMHEAVIDILEK